MLSSRRSETIEYPGVAMDHPLVRREVLRAWTDATLREHPDALRTKAGDLLPTQPPTLGKMTLQAMPGETSETY